MAFDAANLILSSATGYYAPEGTALPTDTLAAGSAWGDAWQCYGFSGAPLKMGYKFATVSPAVQEALSDMKRAKSSEELTFETVMVELNATQMPLAWEGTNAITVAASGQPGKQEFKLAGKRTLTASCPDFLVVSQACDLQ